MLDFPTYRVVTASFEIFARLELPQHQSSLRTKVYNDIHLRPLLAIPLQHSIRLVLPDEFPLYDRRAAVRPLDDEDDAAIIEEMGQLNLTGERRLSRETERITVAFDGNEGASLRSLDLALMGGLIVGVDDDGQAWVWIGSCDFARDDES